MKKIYKDIETAKKIYIETEKSKLEKLELSIQDDVKSLYSKYIDLTEQFDTIVAPVSKVRNDVKKWVSDR